MTFAPRCGAAGNFARYSVERLLGRDGFNVFGRVNSRRSSGSPILQTSPGNTHLTLMLRRESCGIRLSLDTAVYPVAFDC